VTFMCCSSSCCCICSCSSPPSPSSSIIVVSTPSCRFLFFWSVKSVLRHTRTVTPCYGSSPLPPRRGGSLREIT
jgi:hypothetical protein